MTIENIEEPVIHDEICPLNGGCGSSDSPHTGETRCFNCEFDCTCEEIKQAVQRTREEIAAKLAEDAAASEAERDLDDENLWAEVRYDAYYNALKHAELVALNITWNEFHKRENELKEMHEEAEKAAAAEAGRDRDDETLWREGVADAYYSALKQAGRGALHISWEEFYKHEKELKEKRDEAEKAAVAESMKFKPGDRVKRLGTPYVVGVIRVLPCDDDDCVEDCIEFLDPISSEPDIDHASEFELA